LGHQKYFKLGAPKTLKGLDESDRQFQLAYLNDLLDVQGEYQILLEMFENPSYGIDQPIDNSSILIIQSQDDES
jgi:hypothetical protein